MMNEPILDTYYDRMPKHFKCAGQKFDVCHVERTDGNALGNCAGGMCKIEIADKYNKEDKQSDDSKVNTFYHELAHAILMNTGYDELNEDHKFVCSFSALLTEAMRDARFIVKYD